MDRLQQAKRRKRRHELRLQSLDLSNRGRIHLGVIAPALGPINGGKTVKFNLLDCSEARFTGYFQAHLNTGQMEAILTEMFGDNWDWAY